MSNYHELFQRWADVQYHFEMSEPEPDEVLYARYLLEWYEGESSVIYRNGDQFYWNRAYHCSCYGLEGQWEPESYSAELFLAAYERGRWSEDQVPGSVVQRVREFLEIAYHGA